tara:strand:- start:5305 stop:5553 length:249 start_codon:yes stop_codon:yes gene_type:complete
MYICLCYGVTDGNIQDHLDDFGNKTSSKNVHKACSGAQKPNCGKCIPMIKDMVDHHNNKITIGELSDTMKQVTAANKKPETI